MQLWFLNWCLKCNGVIKQALPYQVEWRTWQAAQGLWVSPSDRKYSYLWWQTVPHHKRCTVSIHDKKNKTTFLKTLRWTFQHRPFSSNKSSLTSLAFGSSGAWASFVCLIFSTIFLRNEWLLFSFFVISTSNMNHKHLVKVRAQDLMRSEMTSALCN